MPSEREHLLAAEENKALAVSLAESAPKWSVVLAFYSALHLVDAVLAQRDVHPQDHRRRHSYIAQTPDLSPIHDAFRILDTRSRDVRYRLHRVSTQEAEALVANELAAIEETVRNLLSR